MEILTIIILICSCNIMIMFNVSNLCIIINIISIITNKSVFANWNISVSIEDVQNQASI